MHFNSVIYRINGQPNMKIHNLPSFLLTLLILSIAIEVNASAFDTSISITGSTTFDASFSSENTTGQMGNIENGSLTTTSLSGSVATGANPLLGTLTNIGDSFSFGGSGNATPTLQDFAIGIGNQIIINNSGPSAFEVVLQLDYENTVDSFGTDAFSDSEFSLSLDGGGTEHFFTDLVSDTANGNTRDGNDTGNSGGELSIDGFLTITLLLAASDSITLDSFWTVEGGAFETNDTALFNSEFTFSVISVTNRSIPPAIVPTPGTLVLMGLSLISFGLSRKANIL